MGLCCFILIALFVLDELSYDRYNARANQIYRINCDLTFNGTELHMPVTSDMMGQTLKKDYPQVLAFARIFDGGNKLIKKGNDFINESRIANVDSTFFDLFTFTALAGDTRKALDEPNTVVITEPMAKKYFPASAAMGMQEVVGKTLETDEKILYKVTAVIREMPSNSHFPFRFPFLHEKCGLWLGQLPQQ